MKKSTKKLALKKETLTTVDDLNAVRGGDLYYTVIIIWDPQPEPLPPVVYA